MLLVLIFSILNFCNLFAFSQRAHGIKNEYKQTSCFFKLHVAPNINSLSKTGIHIHNVICAGTIPLFFCE